MTKVVDKKITLDLTTIDGNAFMLMGAFQHQARIEKWSDDEIRAVLKECKKSDYDHLLETLVDHIEME